VNARGNQFFSDCFERSPPVAGLRIEIGNGLRFEGLKHRSKRYLTPLPDKTA
jgi:hypothetical protein